MNGKKAESTIVLAVRLSILAIPLLLGIILFEILVRVTGTDVNPNPNWHYHSILGWTQNPNAQYEYILDGEEVHVEFNSLGFRDVERSIANPEKYRRIVVLGDSFSEAVEVNLEETFHHRLQQLLNEEGNAKWQVINLGVGDFGNAQELIALREYGLDYDPEIVIFQIFPLNDICNNSLELSGLCKSPNDPYRPYFREENGDLVLTSAQPVRNFLRRNLGSYGILERAFLTFLQPPQDPENEEFREQRMIQLGYAPVDPLLLTYVSDQEQIAPIIAGWRILEMILTEMNHLLAKSGAKLIPLVIPFKARVGPGWQEFARSTPNLNMIQDYPERRIGEVCGELGIKPILMKEVFEQNPDQFFPMRGGHLNPEAHRMVAERIYEYLSDHGLIG